MSGIGHNRGPSLEKGAGFRRTAWARSRHALLTHNVPLEILRRRVARAQALGLEYRTYAAIRAGTGEDIETMLFTSNALRLLRPADAIPAEIAQKLPQIAARLDATHTPRIRPSQLGQAGFTTIRPAPPIAASWSELAHEMKTWLAGQRLPPDRVVMIGETHPEQEHATAGRLAAFLTSPSLFPQHSR